MNNIDDLKALWQTAKTNELPSSKEMMKLVRTFKNQKLRSKRLVIGLSLLLCCLIIAALVISPFKFWSTYLGGCLMALSCLLMAVSNIRSIKRFYQLDDCSNVEFLAFIEQTRQNQIFYYKKTIVIVVLVSSIGWGLYFFEIIHAHTGWFIGIYTAFMIYIGMFWFIVRPRSFKRNAEKLNAMTKRLEHIANQLK